MNNAVKITIKKELRGIVRDRKSLLMMLVTPILIPVFIFLFSGIYDSMMNKDTTVKEYNVGINYELTPIEKDIIKELNFDYTNYDTKDEMQDAFDSGEIDAYIVKDGSKYQVYSNSMSQDSGNTSYSITTYLKEYNDYLAKDYLLEINADPDKVYNNIEIEFEELQGSNDLVNEIMFTGLMFAIMAITLTAIYCATDSVAGEKERGTLETILTFPIKSDELILGKFLAITFACIITSLMCMILSIVSLNIASNIFSIYKDTVLNFNFLTVSLSLLLMFSYSFLISGLSIAIASFSKTYKEAQSALTPLSLLSMIPMFLELMGVELTTALAFVPGVNHSMLLNTIICSNIGSQDYINIIITLVSTVVYTLVVVKYLSKIYKSEKIIFAD